MEISPFAYLLFGAFLAVLYVWPAYARLWRPFVVSMGVALLVLVLFWTSAFVGPIAPEERRGIAWAIDLAFRGLASAYVIMACAVQGMRHWADKNGVTAYRHWIAVLLGALVTPFLIVPHF